MSSPLPSLLLSLSVTPLLLFVTIPLFDTGLKVAETLPYILTLTGAVVAACVGALVPKASMSLSLGLALTAAGAVALGTTGPVTFYALLPLSVAASAGLHARAPSKAPPLTFCLIVSLALLSLLDSYFVFHLHEPGYFLRCLSAAVAPESALHGAAPRGPQPQHPVLAWAGEGYLRLEGRRFYFGLGAFNASN